MGIYGYSESQIESMVAKSRRYRVRYYILASVAIAATVVLLFLSPRWFELGRTWWIAFITTLFVHPLIQHLRFRKRLLPELQASRRQMKFDVSAERVSYAAFMPRPFTGGAVIAGTEVRQIERSAMVRAEELSSGWRKGIFLRTSNRYQWLRIPRKIDGYEQLKGELISMGIPVVPVSIGPNWEEFVFIFLFVATLICPILTMDMRVRMISLVLSLLLVVPGILVSRLSYTCTRKSRKLAYFGIFIPAAYNIALLFLDK